MPIVSKNDILSIMPLLLAFAFISGLVTIFAPCIWPLLPIILSSTTTGGHRKPLGITLGIITSFAIFTLTLSYIVKLIPFDPNILRLLSVLIIGFLGLSLVIPKLSAILEGFVSRLSSRFTPQNQSNGFWSGLITGLSLGIVWSPCAGPILATIATLAATQSVDFKVILVTIVYVLGVGIPLFIFATLGRSILTKTPILSRYTGVVQRIFGVIMILTAIAIYTNYDKVLQVKLLDFFPAYTQYLTALESQPEVSKQLQNLKGSPPPTLIMAPDFVGITKWLNTTKPLTMADLKGRVVLIDFWTYTCINCIRTLPHVTAWYEKYKDKGFMVIGVHTPEFEFEKNTENVLAAMKQYGINYPVAQDNDYLTWQAYNNHYWPAEYLLDTKGNVRRTHFGEGGYEETEKAIQDLLQEAGLNGNMDLVRLTDQTPKGNLTRETYLGSDRSQDNGQTLNINWDIAPEYAESKAGAALDFKFNAAKVYLVITPKTSGDLIKVSLDGKSIAQITAGKSKLYTLVDLKESGSHLLHLDFLTEGTKIYAFTFGD